MTHGHVGSLGGELSCSDLDDVLREIKKITEQCPYDADTKLTVSQYASGYMLYYEYKDESP